MQVDCGANVDVVRAQVCREWVPSMLRLGDTIYAMTLMRQDQALEQVLTAWSSFYVIQCRP